MIHITARSAEHLQATVQVRWQTHAIVLPDFSPRLSAEPPTVTLAHYAEREFRGTAAGRADVILDTQRVADRNGVTADRCVIRLCNGLCKPFPSFRPILLQTGRIYCRRLTCRGIGCHSAGGWTQSAVMNRSGSTSRSGNPGAVTGSPAFSRAATMPFRSSRKASGSALAGMP